MNAEAAANFTPERRDYERCVSFRGMGYDLVELGRLDDAEAAYRKCLAIIPDEPKSLGEIEYAIAREKALKAWKRAWKIELIERVNPGWEDLFYRIA